MQYRVSRNDQEFDQLQKQYADNNNLELIN